MTAPKDRPSRPESRFLTRELVLLSGAAMLAAEPRTTDTTTADGLRLADSAPKADRLAQRGAWRV